MRAFQPPRTTWIEVNRQALANNVRLLRSRLASSTELMAVVKANAYGHGAPESARAIAAAGADRLAVATLAEAVALRAAGISIPILVLGYTPAYQAPAALDDDITLTVLDPNTAGALQDAAAARSRALKIHVKVNTGMNRIGLPPEQVADFLQSLRSLEYLDVEGIYTHFATADELDKRHAEAQFSRFQQLLIDLQSLGTRPPIAHAANSAALLTMPHTHLDMVRSGIALYGLAPDMDQCPLPPGFLPAMRWKALVTQVTDLRPGDGVSYGREFVATRNTRAAAIPVGYADGFPRKPFNWGSVLIRGHEAPILGRVCMDQTVVDVTDIERITGPVGQGEEVVLLGPQGERRLTAELVSKRTGTNNYDVVSRILGRVPRVYVDEE